MIKGMTGYAQTSIENENYLLDIEIKTVNHKYFDIKFRTPKFLNSIEENIKEIIKRYINRGHIDVNIKFSDKRENSSNIAVNHSVVNNYIKAYNDIKETYGINSEITLGLVTKSGDCFEIKNEKIDDDELLNIIEPHLIFVLEKLVKMRENGGAGIYNAINKNLEEVVPLIEKIKENKDIRIEKAISRIKQKVKTILEDKDINEDRVLQEIIILSDKYDITEELNRLDNHILLFRKNLMSDASIGKKLDFILQEINRELNTIGAKSYDIIVSQAVIDLKNEFEKIREQVQNIE